MAWFDSLAFDWHEGPHGHPERPERHQAIRSVLEGKVREGKTRGGDEEELIPTAPTPVARSLLERVHDAGYIERLERLATFGGGNIDPDTYVGPHSVEAALLAAGAVSEAVDGVLAGRFRSAFCSVRPPGHHACRDRGMGFCLFNNVVVGAQRALMHPDVGRVAILDFDVHHGNGTEELTYERGDVFFASIHQYPSYPGTGDADRRGRGEGLSTNLNVPLPPGAGDEEFVAAFSERIGPALEKFAPDFLLISAGFDADARDPLAELEVTAAGFRRLSQQVVCWADAHVGGRIVSTLEGGYDLAALGEDVLAHVETLLRK